MSPSNSSKRRIKVARLIDKYGLSSIGEEMEHKWTAESDDRMSLRDLAEFFNQQMLEAALAEAGTQPLSGEVQNIYRLLTDEEVSEADVTRTRRRLERDGVDVGTLEQDFVTYQAIRTYLREHRGAEHATDDRPRTEVETENMQRIRGRTITVTEGKLEQLVKGDHLSLGDFRVFMEITVLCEDCNTQYTVTDLLEREECECERPS